MSGTNRLFHFAAVTARKLHLWPIIARSGIYNRARRRKYPDSIVHLDVVLTECCSLRCRDCSNLMQYYHNPANLDVNEIIRSLQILLAAVRVNQLKILGGEPFVCQKQLIRLLEYLREEADQRIGEIEIITNGTIVPSDECIMALKENPKLKVVFSNYGELSNKLSEFADICKREHIRYEVIEDKFWWDFGKPVLRDEKEGKTQHRYDGCYSRRLCTTLYRGRLYVCPRQAHALNLGFIPDCDDETVNIMNPEFAESEALYDAVYSIVDRKKYITACKYCGSDSVIKVERAIQSERPSDVS